LKVGGEVGGDEDQAAVKHRAAAAKAGNAAPANAPGMGSSDEEGGEEEEEPVTIREAPFLWCHG
jgi:hypothetical protein